MHTYATLMSGKEYRPHLDSQDFIKFLRFSVIIALLLSAAFSIRGNYLGLSQTLERDFVWLSCIAAGITITSSLLAMLTVIRLDGLTRIGRVFIGIVAIGIFYISTRLTLIGFGAGELTKIESMLKDHPEVIEAKAELQQIIDRQNEYGISHSEKLSLLAREREQRAWIRDIQKRLLVENRKQKSKAEKAVGSKEMQVARQMFAIAPDISIAILSPLLVLLFGVVGANVQQVSRNEHEVKPQTIKERILLIPENVVNKIKQDENVIIQEKSQQEIQQVIENAVASGGNDGNGKGIIPAKNEQAIINEKWQPF
jgi:hypothetical protein